MTGFFVTATGTEIGKTFITAGLVRHLRARGLAGAALKPVVSGFTMENAGVSDPGLLLDAMGEAVTAESVAAISPWRFRAPLSPDMAAAREGRTIDWDELLGFCRARMAGTSGTLFIEGVGGVMAPLDGRHTVCDWMAALGLPLIMATGSYLGSISHTLTALDVVARRGLKLAALIVNETGDGAVPLDDTVATLARFAAPVPILPLRREPAASAFDTVWRVLAA